MSGALWCSEQMIITNKLIHFHLLNKNVAFSKQPFQYETFRVMAVQLKAWFFLKKHQRHAILLRLPCVKVRKYLLKSVQQMLCGEFFHHNLLFLVCMSAIWTTVSCPATQAAVIVILLTWCWYTGSEDANTGQWVKVHFPSPLNCASTRNAYEGIIY